MAIDFYDQCRGSSRRNGMLVTENKRVAGNLRNFTALAIDQQVNLDLG